jgi:hypothetical protein
MVGAGATELSGVLELYMEGLGVTFIGIDCCS